MSPPVWWQDRFENLGLFLECNPHLCEHAKELYRREDGVDRGIVRTGTCSDVRDAHAIVTVQGSEIPGACDRRRHERNEKAREIRPDFQQRVTHMRTRAEDCRIIAASNLSQARRGKQLVAPRGWIDRGVASSLAGVGELHWCCWARREHCIDAEDRDRWQRRAQRIRSGRHRGRLYVSRGETPQ